MKKTLAAFTAVALAAGLTLAAFAAPASADNTPAPVASSTPSSSPSATPSATPSSTPTEDPTPTLTTTTTPAAATSTASAPAVGEFAAASTASPYTTYETIVWSMAPGNGSPVTLTDGSATYPQVGVSQYKGENTEFLGVAIPSTCGGTYQIDVYIQKSGTVDNTAALDKLFASGLQGPNGAQDGQYLAPGGLGVAWAYHTNNACPPPPCVPDSQVKYTYDSTTNSGVITVPNPAGYSGVLCTPFYVTAASWTFDTAGSLWKQTISQSNHVNGVPVSNGSGLSNVAIQKAGTYSYGATIACGQGDIYASFTANDATLFPETPGHLNGPSNPFTEHFLSSMNFTGPSPTYMVTGTNCNTNVAPVTPTVDPITTCGQYGSITIPGSPYTAGVVYTYNGKVEPAGTVITNLSGSQTVIATPASGYKFTGPQSVTYTLDLGSYATCDLTITDPTVANPVCTGTDAPDNGSITVKTNVFVAYTLTGPGITGSETFASSATDGTPVSISGLAPGQYTVTATGLQNHTINGQTVFTFNIITLTNPYCTVIAPVVTSTAPTCAPDPGLIESSPITAADSEVQGVINLPINSDVVYSIDGGAVVPAGSYTEADGTHHVTATLTSTNIANGITIVANPGVYTLSNNDTVATWTITFDAGCDVLPAWNAGATSTDATCAADSLGTITLSHEQGTQPNDVKYVVTNDANSHVVYSGTDVNDTVLHVAPGHYTVTASPVDPADGISGDAGPYAVTVAAVAAICGGGDTSLAFTGGTIAWFGFVLAGGMLFLGIAFLLIRRRANRTAD